MKNVVFVSFGLVAALSLFGICAVAQNKCVDPGSVRLSELGKKAFESLEKETLFALGGIGYSGERSAGEEAMRALLAESSREMALLKLSTSDSGAGGLYGIIGLKILKSDCFAEAYKLYARLPDKRETKGRHGTLEAGEVGYMVGCLYSVYKRKEIANDISDGKLDMWIRSIESKP